MTVDPAHTWTGCSTSVDQTMAIGSAVAVAAEAGDVIALIGELGAGKTQFVRGLARGLGLHERAVSSPTFVMVQEYRAEDVSRDSSRPSLVHIDAYRLNSLDDLESIGWDLDGSEIRAGAIVVIEWADRLDELAGSDKLIVELGHVENDHRDVVVTAHGAWQARMSSLKDKLDAIAVVKADD